MPNLLVFQHVPHEALGAFEALFREQAWEPRYIQSYRTDLTGKNLEDLGNADAVVVLGGPMSANDGERLSFIREELRLIEAALKRGLPFLGICLGSQLLAKVLGAKVYPGTQKEIGWYPLRRLPAAREDPLLRAWPEQGPMFQWHGETFEKPAGAELLAASDLYPHQAFRYGAHAYGFQFHPEMTAQMVEEWIQEGKEEIESAKLPHGPDEIRRLCPENLIHLNRLAKLTVEGFISLSPRGEGRGEGPRRQKNLRWGL